MTGQVLGHYEVLEPLGSGGMGEVFKARDTRLNRLVAIKLLHADALADPVRKHRFVQEAQAASGLNHPSIITIHDIADQNGVDYMVMELVSGRTLDALIPNGGMRLTDALKIAIPIADALAKAHAAGIVHRDLKPANVMISDDGHPKLLDFGLAKLAEPPASQDDRTRTQRLETEEGTILGTVAYMSPEQAEGRKLDARSDIFSFGSVLYEMVTGRRPFTGESKMSTLSSIIKEEPKPIGNAPADLEKIVRRCLRKDPARRFQTMADLRVALEDLREDSESGRLAAPAAPAAAPQPKPARGIPKWIWPVAAAGVAAAVWAFSVSPRPEAPPPEALRTVPLTTYTGAEMQPSLSPDGRQVAFSWNGEKRDNVDIYVKMVDGGDPLRLTTDPAREVQPQWSPDGRFIAFRRAGAIYRMSPLGGPQQKLADTSAPFTWSPDSKSIVFSESPNPDIFGSLIQLDLETGERRKITAPPSNARGDGYPAFSPDGRTLAFGRGVAAVATTEVIRKPLAGGAETSVPSPGNFIYELAWSPDGKDVIAVVETGGTTALWRFPPDPGKPSRIAGLDAGARFPSVSAASHRLVYSRVLDDQNIWSSDGHSSVELIASTRRDFNPQISPDGSRIAFVSDRTGGWEIYAAGAQGERSVQLTSFGSLVADGIRWSPDGRELAFAVLSGADRNIYTVPADGGVAKKLTSEPSDEGRPSFSMDGRWIYFRSNRSGAEEIWKLPRQGGPATQVTKGGGFEAVESLDGKILFLLRSRTTLGLWSMPTAGGDPRPVVGLERVSAGRWAVTEEGVCYAAPRENNRSPVFCWNASSGASTPKGSIDRPWFLAAPSFSASRDGRRFLWNQSGHQDADLVLVENFR